VVLVEAEMPAGLEPTTINAVDVSIPADHERRRVWGTVTGVARGDGRVVGGEGRGVLSIIDPWSWSAMGVAVSRA
jgi:hypothetical protein